MRKTAFKSLALIGIASMISLSSCSDDEDEKVIIDNGGLISPVTTPVNYEFSRLGQSSVDYSGQTSRLDQLAELTVELKRADAGNSISSATLLNMFGNTNNPFSQAYPKDLKSKTFAADTSYFKNLMTEMANNSGTTDTAKSGTAGLLTRSNGNTILVDANGREYTQLIEKGLMGATFYYQIANTYLTEEKIGSAVNNSDLIDTAAGKYYTAMEHHFDEAFGYMGFPTDFSSNYDGAGTVRFWGKYSNTADDDIQSNGKIMNAFKLGRAAIVAKDYSMLNSQVDVLYDEIDKMMAATAIHYINSTLSDSNIGDRHHHLSEAYVFIWALRYANIFERKLSDTEVLELCDTKIGSNYYNTTATDLNFIKDKLSSTYGLDTVKDNL